MFPDALGLELLIFDRGFYRGITVMDGGAGEVVHKQSITFAVAFNKSVFLHLVCTVSGKIAIKTANNWPV